MTRKLHISDELALPLEVGTQALLVLGLRGSGKTNTAGVIAEELLDAGVVLSWEGHERQEAGDLLHFLEEVEIAGERFDAEWERSCALPADDTELEGDCDDSDTHAPPQAGGGTNRKLAMFGLRLQQPARPLHV